MVPRLILASGSPRRRQLLTASGFEFDVVSPAVSEIFNRHLTIREVTICNATRKALSIARERPDSIVLAADTLVGIDGKVIGKPADLDDAAGILRRLGGREHEVFTAVFICWQARRRAMSFHEVSRVHFHKLSDRMIAAYLAKVNPLDKAGAYAAQGHGSDLIARIAGSYTNVVGLPMERTKRALREFGIEPRRAAQVKVTMRPD